LVVGGKVWDPVVWAWVGAEAEGEDAGEVGIQIAVQVADEDARV
jgi:hypothetical protein